MRLHALELFGSAVPELGFVGVVVVVIRLYLIDAEQALRLADVALRVGVQVYHDPVFQLSSPCAHEMVDAAMHPLDLNADPAPVNLYRLDFIGPHEDAALHALEHELKTAAREHLPDAAVSVGETLELVRHGIGRSLHLEETV